MKPLRGLFDSRLWLSAVLVSSSAQAGVLPDGVETSVLDSGLTIIAVPLQTPDLVSLQVWMDVGARHETEPGSTGYAHFAEHLLFRGSENFSAEERQARILELGIIDNAWTSSDNTCYHLLFRADRLEGVLELEADRFLRLALTDAAVRKESGAVAGEHRKELSDPESAVYKSLWATAFSQHTYHHTTIGFDEDVAQMPDGLPVIERFLDAWYRPDTATIIIAGDLEPAGAIAMATEAFGAWEAVEVEPPPPLKVEPVQTEARRAVVDWSGGPTPARLAVGWKTPAFVPGEGDGAAWLLLNSLLTERASPLHRRLIEGAEAPAWSMWSESPSAADPGLLALFIELKSGGDVAGIEAIIAEEIAALRDLTPEQLDRAKQRARRALLMSLDSPRRWASQIGWYTSLGGDPGALDRHLDALAAVAVADIVRLIDTALVADQQTVVVLEETP
ncbi:MAG: pitrilysin family protein [Myxococcota bacterium]|nr:pitrilysin family protein [Myxococcota bacterium]